MKRFQVHVKPFAEAMRAKLASKASKGWSGWDSPEWPTKDKIRRIEEHLVKMKDGDLNQAVDIANFCLFIWHDQQRAKPRPQSLMKP